MRINDIQVLMDRPTLCIEEIDQGDGTFKVGWQHWMPIVIYCDKFKDKVLALPDEVSLTSDKEKWSLEGCKFIELDGPFCVMTYEVAKYM